MDWAPTEMQQAVRELAGQVLQAPDPWAALVEAELLEVDGILELCTLLIEVGRVGATVPVLETALLGGPAPGAGVKTGAMLDVDCRDPRGSTTVAEAGHLTGTKVCVPAADRASVLVVPATDGLYAVRTEDCEVVLDTGTDGLALGTVRLERTPAERLGGPEAIQDWYDRVQIGICALQLGICKAALRMTSAYLTERQQFGVPIGTFQAVSQRAADAWIELQAMEVTMWQAAWRLSEGRPLDRERMIARYWASEGSHRILAAAQHLHGGMGFDRDYALHRYFLAGKQWEFVGGGAAEQLHALGELIRGRAR